ncbi:GNAT family N-acetyltransferase [Rossellomorea vietnamensis]|uniref:GNAT family N-acetyltransferase n=2 Tax=Rossellomorea TaxID=2837508 RepID=A0A5D4KIL5_9BACI|nr:MULTISPECIES: GNAT family N-acetyltransferase [Rossellomorea]TYR77072.1 GNAT family N-acetyltransferase [Rossellomorea vietnamensis]TYS71108.1 GNAT family N-acetyltransferase [Rossellomorea aquimaris]
MKNALILLCPSELLQSPPQPVLPKGYYARNYREDDKLNYKRILEDEGWKLSNEELDEFFTRVLPDGLYFLVNEESEEIVASAVALHNPKSSYYTFPFGGDIGFVFTNPVHRNKGLGLYVTSLATKRLISSGYKSIRIVTNDHRLPALKTYLKLGFKPFLYSSDMEERWENVYKKLEIKFNLEVCIKI